MAKDKDYFAAKMEQLCADLDDLSLPDKIAAINTIKQCLHEHSPFKDEPVDCVVWVPGTQVEANAWNPNFVPAVEFELLEHSIRCDHFTQPIVAFEEKPDAYEVVDGYHRNKIAKIVPDIKARLNGYLPITIINASRTNKMDRMASTVRHNRARGKHGVGPMSDIVVELSRRNWSDKRIAKELGMDQDEVLRLKQVSGLAALFADKEFSEAWEIE